MAQGKVRLHGVEFVAGKKGAPLSIQSVSYDTKGEGDKWEIPHKQAVAGNDADAEALKTLGQHTPLNKLLDGVSKVEVNIPGATLDTVSHIQPKFVMFTLKTPYEQSVASDGFVKKVLGEGTVTVSSRPHELHIGTDIVAADSLRGVLPFKSLDVVDNVVSLTPAHMSVLHQVERELAHEGGHAARDAYKFTFDAHIDVAEALKKGRLDDIKALVKAGSFSVTFDSEKKIGDPARRAEIGELLLTALQAKENRITPLALAAIAKGYEGAASRALGKERA